MKANHVSVRLNGEIFARVNALIPQIKIEGRKTKRSDVLRLLILSGLTLQETARPSDPAEEEQD